MNKYQDILNKYQYNPVNYTLENDTLVNTSRFDELERLDSGNSEQKQDGFLKSIVKEVAGTLVVKPVARATEALTRTLAPNSVAAKGYEMMADEGGQNIAGIDVSTPTGRQIAGEALQTASYLFPYGKAAGLAGKAIGKIAGNVASGATGGYLADAGYGLVDEGQSVGEALTPGLGTTIGAAIPLVGPTLRATGRATSKLGSKAVESVIPNSTREAGMLQTYKANNPFLKRVADVLKGTEKAPTTAGKTITTKGLMGTKSQIGVQAKRAEQKLWNDIISPRLKASEQAVDLDGFFAKIQDDIVKNNPEMARQKSLLNALNSFKDDYAGINSVSLEKLQKLKEGWAEFVPEKFYKGENIAGNAKQVQALMASEARQTIYSQLGDDVKQAYFDYGNLQGIKKMGQVAMTGSKLKGGSGSFISEIASQAVTPIGTVGGQAIYRIGKGIEFIGKLGAKNVGEALGVNFKFPGDKAVDDIGASLKKASKIPNKQGGFIKVGQEAKAPILKQTTQTAAKTSKNIIPKTIPQEQSLINETKVLENLAKEAKKYKSAESFVKAKSGNQGVYTKDYLDTTVKVTRASGEPFDFKLMEDFMGANPEIKGDMVKVYRLTTKNKTLMPGDHVSIKDVSKFKNPGGGMNLEAAKLGITKLMDNPDVKLITQWIPKDSLYQATGGGQMYAPKGIKSLQEFWQKANKK